MLTPHYTDNKSHFFVTIFAPDGYRDLYCFPESYDILNIKLLPIFTILHWT